MVSKALRPRSLTLAAAISRGKRYGAVVGREFDDFCFLAEQGFWDLVAAFSRPKGKAS